MVRKDTIKSQPITMYISHWAISGEIEIYEYKQTV